MHFIGVDLAWGERKPTGIAVLDADAHLVSVGSMVSDDDILAALSPYDGPLLVAFDAPLIVRNATGNRPCEAQLNRDFGRFDAGAHPSNTGKAELADGPRGARLADVLGLDIHPDSRSDRRGIEVYPHPATVALFGLGRTLKYKNRPGRVLEQLRAELLRLMRLVEGLEDDRQVPMSVRGHQGWQELVRSVETARRKAALRQVEDQVDAVLCAYVALFSQRCPELTTTYGDGDSGYIVTPRLPPDLVPASGGNRDESPVREGAAVRADIDQSLRAYAENHAVLQAATERYVATLTSLLDEAGINYLSVTGRAKGVASFAAKATRQLDGRVLFPDPLRDISDQIGLRVITYLRRDVDAVADLLGEELVVFDDRDLGMETASEGRFGYASRHLLVRLPPGAEDQAIGSRHAQVQVRTVLQHAWAEFEHATRYKGTIPAEHATDLDRRFTLAAGLLELADEEFSAIHERLQASGRGVAPGPTENHGISSEDLATFLTERYAEAGWSRADHYSWVSGLLLELGISSVEALDVVLDSVDEDALNDRMGYRYPPGAVRRLDDALLAIFTERYTTLSGNAHRVDLLRSRLARLVEVDSTAE